MEIFSMLRHGGGTRTGDILHMAFYFAGFGLAVGGALGMTEGFVLKNRSRLRYGLIIGLILGTVGGFAGGVVGQTIYGLVPLRYASQSNADIAIALDSSGSMSMLFTGNDPWGKRKKAARKLVDRLSTTDRVAVVDFDEAAQVLFPLTALDSQEVRNRAKAAIDRVDSTGGTSLDAGLAASIGELLAAQVEGRQQHVIFLTDGEGDFTEGSLSAERVRGITIHTIGLGDGVDASLLTRIAETTGGRYYPVEDASELIAVFEKIFTENIVMTDATSGESAAEGELLTDPRLLLIVRILSWGAMGLAIGAGQGIRENTREDFRACALGGLIGGLIGGALFNPVSEVISLGAGLFGRGLADLVVGACIGGTMRIAQVGMVEASGKPTTTLLTVLPKKQSLVLQPKAPARPTPFAGHRPPPDRVRPAPQTPPKPPDREGVVPPKQPPIEADQSLSEGREARKALSYYQEQTTDPARAMAMAYHSGDYTLREIAQHFGVQSSSVKRAADQHPG